MTQTDQELDRIERSIDIDAPAEKVWALVERPGWWINESEVDPDPEIRYEDDVAVVVHPTYGEFRIQTVETDRPRYVKYRWIDTDSDGGTLVEFRIDDRPAGGVTLKVVESGFLSLGKDHEALVKHYQGNTEGWELELAAAERFVTRDSA